MLIIMLSNNLPVVSTASNLHKPLPLNNEQERSFWEQCWDYKHLAQFINYPSYIYFHIRWLRLLNVAAIFTWQNKGWHVTRLPLNDLCVKPGLYFLRMRYEFLRHKYATNNSEAGSWGKPLRNIRSDNAAVTSEFAESMNRALDVSDKLLRYLLLYYITTRNKKKEEQQKIKLGSTYLPGYLLARWYISLYSHIIIFPITNKQD